MKKLMSLIKVCLNHDMNLFKINTRKQSKFSKVILPLLLAGYIMVFIGMYANELMKVLMPVNLGFATLTLFSLMVTFLSFLEGIYKSGPLLFNAKDDNLLFSLPIKRETVLFIRILKFYVFELLYNSLFILPAMVVYAIRINPSWTYYLVSVVALLILPIVPIVISVILGFIITYFASRFKGKNIFQTVFSLVLVLFFMYLSFNMDGFMSDIASKASSINDFITRLYYPVGTYISLVTEFNIGKLLIYILIHLGLMALVTYILGKVYFKINSRNMGVLHGNNKHEYKVRSTRKAWAFVKKELTRFLNSPVFLINAAFGLVLFIIAAVVLSTKINPFMTAIIEVFPELTERDVLNRMPVILLAMVAFSSVMSSITSSMISLEGKSFAILKSLPLTPLEIAVYKVLTALVVMIPLLLIGDIVVFVKFKFDILSIILIVASSFIMPLVAEVFGIIVNLKYPKMDASNDTEVVKQSMSTMVATFGGMGLGMASVVVIFSLVNKGFSNNVIMLIFLTIFSVLALILSLILYKKGPKLFNNIVA